MRRALLLLLCATTATADDWPGFRGPDRQGRCRERGLLARWPANGPPERWWAGGLGQGYSQPVIAGGRIHVTGKHGDTGTLFTFDTSGKLLWKAPYGRETEGAGYPGARGAPTVDGKRIYVVSGVGRLVCLDAVTGQRRWSRDLVGELGGAAPRWGYAESVLIDGERLICTPGGKGAVVALDRRTGRTLWTCRGIDRPASYCSAVLLPRRARRLIVTVLDGLVAGIDAATGTLLWSQPHRTPYGVSAVSPLLQGDLLYTSSAFSGSLLLRLSADGARADAVWRQKLLDTTHGGAVLVDGHVYASSSRNPRDHWLCIELATGKERWRARGVGQGSVLAADGMLYCYGEQGELALVRPSPAGYQQQSRFRVLRGSGPHWAHPVISDGRLYIRHGDALICYGIGR